MDLQGQKPDTSGVIVVHGRFSLREMSREVQIERRESNFGRELIDAAEIERMFSKRKLRRKKK